MCHLFFATSNNALLPFPLQTACSPLSPKLFRMELFRRGAIKVRNGRIGKGVVRRIVTMGGGRNYPTFPFPAKNFTCIFTLLTSEVLLYFSRLLRLSYNLMKTCSPRRQRREYSRRSRSSHRGSSDFRAWI